MTNKPTIEIQDYLEIFQRRKLQFILPFTLIFVTAVVVMLILPPVYRSEATVFIERQEIPAELVETTVTGFVDERIQIITKRLLTNDKLWEIAEKFDLYSDERSATNRLDIIRKMRDSITVETQTFEEEDTARSRNDEQSLTIAFTVSYESSTPETAQKVANELALLYSEENKRERTEQTEAVSKFLEEEAAQYRDQIAEIDQELAAFKQENVGSLPELANVNLDMLNSTEDQLERVQEEINTIQEQIVNLQSQLATTDPYYNITVPADDIGALPSSQQLRFLKQQYAAARQRYSEEHPDIKRLKNQINALGGTIDSSGNTSAFAPDNPAYISLQAQIESNKIRLKSLESERERLKSKMEIYEERMFKVPAVERDYLAITRDREVAIRKYQDIQDKLQLARLAKNLEQDAKAERFVVLSPASLPTSPSKPNKLAIMLLGFVLAFGSGTGMATLAEYLDHSVHGVRGIKNILSVPPLAEIPYIQTETEVLKKRHRFVAVSGIFMMLLLIALALMHFYFMPLDQLFKQPHSSTDASIKSSQST